MAYAILASVGPRGLPGLPCKGPGTESQRRNAEFLRNTRILGDYDIFSFRWLPALPRKGSGTVTPNPPLNFPEISGFQMRFGYFSPRGLPRASGLPTYGKPNF